MLVKYDKERTMNELRIRIPGALDSVLQLELFNVCDDFLQGTNIWREAISFRPVYPSKVGDTVMIETEDTGIIYQLMGVSDQNRFARAPVGDQLLEADRESIPGITCQQPQILRLAHDHACELRPIGRIQAS